MKNRRKQKLFTLGLAGLLVGFLGSAFGAQESAPAGDTPQTIRLTLEEAERLALERNPDLAAAREEKKAAERKIPGTFVPADPMVMVDKLGQKTSPLALSESSMEMWMVTQPFSFPGKSWVKRKSFQAEVRRREALLDEAKRRALLQAREAYWDYVYSWNVYQVWKQAEEDWKKFSSALQSRELSGQWVSLRILRLQLESARVVNELVKVSEKARAAEAALNHYLSLPPRTVYVLGEEAPIAPWVWKREEAVKAALETSPLLSAAKAEVRRRRAEKNFAALEHLPNFSVRLQGTRDPLGNGFSEYGVRFAVEIPLFFPFRQTQETKHSGDEVRAAEYEQKSMEDAIVHHTEETFAEAQAAWELLELYRKGALIREAKRAWAAAQRAYRNETLDLAELVDHYNLYVDVLSKYYQALADYGKAFARLQYLAGSSGKGEISHEK